MDATTRQLLEVLVALSPFVLFIAMILWSAGAELMEERQDRRARREPAD